MREITNEHAICQEMTASLQATIKSLEARIEAIDVLGKAYQTWYEVAASSPTQGSETIESFDYLEEAKEFALYLLNNNMGLLMLAELADDIESVFINRWTWDGENNNELDQTFTQLKYYIETYEKAKEVNDEQG